MTWRLKIARWLLRPTPEWCIVATDEFAEYLSILSARHDLLVLIERHPHLAPTVGLVPRKPERMH